MTRYLSDAHKFTTTASKTCYVLNTFFIFHNTDPTKSATINLDDIVANAGTNTGFTSFDGPSPNVAWSADDNPCATRYAFSGYRANGLIGVSVFNNIEAPTGYDEFIYSGGNLKIDPYSTVALRGGFYDGKEPPEVPELFTSGGLITPGYDSNLTAKVNIFATADASTGNVDYQNFQTLDGNYWSTKTNKWQYSESINSKISHTSQGLLRIDGGGAERTTDNIAISLSNPSLTSDSNLGATVGNRFKNSPLIIYAKKTDRTIAGSRFGDLIIGGSHLKPQEVYGKKGNDWIEPGRGLEKIHTGRGKDIVHWSRVSGEPDKIIDFNPAKDSLSFNLNAFGSDAYNRLMEKTDVGLEVTGQPVGESPQFVWSPETHMLSFDHDGVGLAKALNIARLDYAPTLESIVFAQEPTPSVFA